MPEPIHQGMIDRERYRSASNDEAIPTMRQTFIVEIAEIVTIVTIVTLARLKRRYRDIEKDEKHMAWQRVVTSRWLLGSLIREQGRRPSCSWLLTWRNRSRYRSLQHAAGNATKYIERAPRRCSSASRRFTRIFSRSMTPKLY